MRRIIQAKLLILCLLLVGCIKHYNYNSIKENPIYFDSSIKGSLSEVMTCVVNSIDKNAFEESFGEKLQFRQEVRAIPDSKKGSIGLYYINGKNLIGLIEFNNKEDLTQVKMYAHQTNSESCITIYDKCKRDKFINAIKVCEK